MNNIHRDLTATATKTTAPIFTGKLKHILRDETNATFFINTPRVAHYAETNIKRFTETYAKQEGVTPRTERVSNEKNGIVKIWVRSSTGYGYLIETDESNVVE